jgi:hypothetical protein
MEEEVRSQESGVRSQEKNSLIANPAVVILNIRKAEPSDFGLLTPDYLSQGLIITAAIVRGMPNASGQAWRASIIPPREMRR